MNEILLLLKPYAIGLTLLLVPIDLMLVGFLMLVQAEKCGKEIEALNRKAKEGKV